jgi:uncharacterized protein YjbI with pentapeptide repeats
MIRTRFFIAICLLACGCLLAVQAEAAGRGLTRQESYVLRQAAAGEFADLKAQFGEGAENRQLSARFLTDLLTGTYKVHPKGVLISHAVITEPLDLLLTRVPQSTIFFNCVFKGRFNCQDAVFEKHLVISGSTFEEEAVFHRVQVKKDLFCQNSTFQGSVDFTHADVGGALVAEGARFLSLESKANFNSLKVGQSAYWRTATFQGPVDFTKADIGVEFNAEGAQFLSKKHPVKFNGLKVGNEVYFKQAIFQGGVDCVGADIGGQFNANGARFLDAEQEVNFNSLKVGKSAFFDNAVFHGPVNFAGAHIGGQFGADGARFLGREKTANFQDMRVGQEALFRNIIFKGDINMGYGAYLALRLKSAKETEPVEVRGLDSLYLTGTVVRRGLRVVNFRLANLEASHLRVTGPATFEGVSIKESANFQNAHLEALRFKNVLWPVVTKNLRLDGLTYTSLWMDKPDNWPGLLAWVDKSAFNPQDYLELEKYYTRSGQQYWADQAYLAMKYRELAQMSWFKAWLLWLVWGSVGYGREPGNALFYGLILIVIGAFFYSPQLLKKEVYEAWETRLTTTRFKSALVRLLLSLDQFLPGLNLGWAQELDFTKVSLGRLVYFTFHRIMGVILILMALAAVVTQLT